MIHPPASRDLPRAAPGGPAARPRARNVALGPGLAFGVGLAASLVPAADAAAGPSSRRDAPRMILVSAEGAERTVHVADFTFVYFERIFYERRAPREEEPSGRRLEIEDRRRECDCIMLEDLQRHKFGKLRQLELLRAPGERHARLRLTDRIGRVLEVPYEALSGAIQSLPPRFAATVDGVVREFYLGPLDAGAPSEEVLARVLFVTSPPPRR